MNVEINLLPEEFKPKPLIQPPTLAILLVVLVLGFGCFHFYSVKADKEAQAAEIETNIESMQSQMMTLQSGSLASGLREEVSALTNEKNQLDQMNSDYTLFTGSRVEWGYVIEKVEIRKPWGVYLTSIVQGGDGSVVTVTGTANNYERETAYVALLEMESKFSDVTTLSWQADSGVFSLSFNVESGGAA